MSLKPLDLDPHGQRMCPRCSQWVVVEEATKCTVLLSCGHWMPKEDWEKCLVRIRSKP